MALIGLDLFREHMAAYADQFTLIGGAACDLWFTEQELAFRLTKDIDLVILRETMDPAFVQAFWGFVNLGGYQLRERTEENPARLYRFSSPAVKGYPFMLELLSPLPEEIFPSPDQHIVPIRLEDTPSLSAILLHADYYDYLFVNRLTVNGFTIASASTLLLMKARAWLDLTQRAENDLPVKGADIKKHRGDVFRLAATLVGTHAGPLPPILEADLRAFLDRFPPDAEVWPAILQSIRRTIPRTQPEALLTTIQEFYQLDS